MVVNESYHVPTEIDPVSEERVNLSRPLPAEFRDWLMSDLDEIEFEFLKTLAGARTAGDASSIDYVENVMHKIDVERDRQARLVRTEAEHRGRRVPQLRHDGPKLAELATQLKESVSLITFIEDSGVASGGDRSGNRRRIHCPNPLHPDANPSCIVDDRRFHCFRCAADGDIFDLVGLVWGVTSFRDRIRIVAEYARQAMNS